MGKKILIHNRLAIPVLVLNRNNKVFVEKRGEAEMFVEPGDKLKIYIHDTNLYQIVSMISMIDRLFIGQITTRYQEDSVTTSVHPTCQGVPWIRIHNHSLQRICLNTDISIEPMTAITYKGLYFSGVPLGMRFKDAVGVYPEVQIDKPITDIYFGFTSRFQQKLYGGWIGLGILENDNEPTYHLSDIQYEGKKQPSVDNVYV